MKTQKITFSVMVMLAFVLSASVVAAGDFDWTRDLNIRAEADRDGFRVQLATRFNIGNAQVNLVLGNVGDPADAYMVLRLAEMSSRSMDFVLNKYETNKHRGWGALAQSLGIKPGSKEFKALKEGHDIYTKTARTNSNRKNKRKGK